MCLFRLAYSDVLCLGHSVLMAAEYHWVNQRLTLDGFQLLNLPHLSLTGLFSFGIIPWVKQNTHVQHLKPKSLALV